MERKRYSVASAMVLFVVVFLCIAVFAILNIMTARAGLKVAERYASHVSDVYACQTKGMETADLIVSMTENYGVLTQESMPDGCEINGDEITVTARENGVECFIRMKFTENGAEIVETRINTMWQEDDSLNLWR